MEHIKRLTVIQICLLGVGAIWFFLTLSLLLFCIYANRRSHRETEEGGRMARGHWQEIDSVEVRRVSEPYTRLNIKEVVTVPKVPVIPTMRQMEAVHHTSQQRGVVSGSRGGERIGESGSGKGDGYVRKSSGGKLKSGSSGPGSGSEIKGGLKRIPKKK